MQLRLGANHGLHLGVALFYDLAQHRFLSRTSLSKKGARRQVTALFKPRRCIFVDLCGILCPLDGPGAQKSSRWPEIAGYLNAFLGLSATWLLNTILQIARRELH